MAFALAGFLGALALTVALNFAMFPKPVAGPQEEGSGPDRPAWRWPGPAGEASGS
jgi:hypothetical protein